MPINWSTTAQSAKQGGIKINVFGRDGDGKTTLIPTAPRPFIADVDKKTLSIAKYNIPGAIVNTWQDFRDVVDWFRGTSTEAKLFDTLCVDSLSTISELLLAEEKIRSRTKAGALDLRKAYPEMRDKLNIMMRDLMSIPDKNVLFLTKASLMDQGDGSKLYSPATPGAPSESGVGYYVNENFCLRIVNPGTPEEWRYLQTSQDGYAQSRDNSNALEAKEKPDITWIINKIRAKF